MNLTPRLSLAAEMVDKGSIVADIGTDHGYLPVYLVRQGICPRAIACDIKALPLEKGRENIAFYHLQDKIETRLSDGLAGINENEADTFTIAGMGADVIIHILSSCPYIKNEKYTLIIQPMSRYYELTKWLFENQFEILIQRCVSEGKRHYTVMKVRFKGKTDCSPCYSPTDIYTGAMDLKNNENILFLKSEIVKAERRALGDKSLVPLIDKLKNLIEI